MLEITSGKVLTPYGWRFESLAIANGLIVQDAARPARLNAAGLMVLPGMIDIHGDAFERQIMPRPNVAFDLGLALRDTDRQLVANGITTAYHGVTSSWETGLRRIENARALAYMISDLRRRTACDMRFHLRIDLLQRTDIGQQDQAHRTIGAHRAHSVPLVLGMPDWRGSGSVAIRSERAMLLKIASAM